MKYARLLVAFGSLVLLCGFGPWKDKSALELTKGYRKWAKANARPFVVPAALVAPCRAITGGPIGDGPHADRTLTVYVNAIGKDAMASGQPFPVGSVIVKEKWVLGAKAPELSTVMVKRDSGWEFAAIDATGRKSLAIDKQSCTRCHDGQAKQDYVFRTYVSR